MIDWNIDRKLTMVTLDNYSTNDAIVSILQGKLPSSSFMLGESLFHMCCSAHILNLIIQYGFNVFDEGIEKIHDNVVVVFFKASPKRNQKFKEAAR